MKVVLGLLCILAGLVLGLYVGVWLMLIGGIVQIVHAISPVDAFGIAIGVVRVLFAGVVGYLAGIVPAAFGVALLRD